MSPITILEIADPETGEVLTFQGATDEQAHRAADEYFGVDVADGEREGAQ